MSADIQHEYPFDIGFATGSNMSSSDLDISQSAFVNPSQLPWSESKSEFKVESSRRPHPVSYADTAGSSAFYDDSNSAPVDAQQLFASQPRPQSPLEMLSTSLMHVVRSSPAAETEIETEGDLDSE